MIRILNDRQEALLKRERQLLDELRMALVNFNADSDDLKTLGDSIHQLDELFLLVVVGEFNAGKSAFINALLGQQLLKEGVTPTTTQINILHYGPVEERTVITEDQHSISLPVEWLAEISIVDTPGTNAIIRSHEEITSHFVPRADLVLFITSADRPFTESERLFLERIRDWGKKVVIVINKIDLFETESDLEQVKEFVTENARNLLGITPEVFPISARGALRAKTGDPQRWDESRFNLLETYIRETLDQRSRLQLKFLNPLGVSEHLTGKYLEVVRNRLELLSDDFIMLDDVESQLDLYREDMHRDFRFRMADIENILFEMESRGYEYFDEIFRLARVFDLLNKDRIRQEFETRVVADAPQRIERRVNELIDWLVDADLRQWQAVTEHLAERRRQHKERIVGESGPGSFNYDRERLMERVGREARRVVDTYDKSEEAQSIAEGAQAAVAASAALEVGALGLGALITILATTVAADVTGVLMASVVAALGLFVIPARRRQAKAEMKDKIGSVRTQLIQSLGGQFEKEIERSMHNIQEAIAPYTRFVRAERKKLTEFEAELKQVQEEIDRLQVIVNEI